jgi:hypothetical protein
MDRMSTIVVKLEHRERRTTLFLACQMSKHDGTSTATATRAARYGSLFGGARSLVFSGG